MRVIVDQPFVSTIVNQEVVSGISMNFPCQTKISEIKEHVSKLTHIPEQYFELALIRQEETMDPDSALADYTCPSTVRLRMVIRTPQCVNRVSLTVKTQDGKCVNVDVNMHDKVSLLKYVIFKKVGIPPDQQRIIYAGKQLEDNHTLSDYNIQTKCVIHLVLRLRGCGSTRVTVLGPNGDEYVYTSPCCCYVTTVKSIVRQQAGIPIEEQRLLLEEVEVEDGEKLKKYTDQPEVRLRLQVIPVV